MNDLEKIYETIGTYFIQGDVEGAIAFMKNIPQLKETAEAYTDIFENEKYIQYDIPAELNGILLCYQQYFRDVFYLHKDNEEAEKLLFKKLKDKLGLSGTEAGEPEEALIIRFRQYGYQILCGKTNGYYGPYVWKETVPVTFDVELPETTSTYRINMLHGFVFRSWMDYLTFGEKGTGGWTSPDGTINCVEKAYDTQSEKFRVSLLKHEAQHAEDYVRWNNIEPWDLEYRAKLVELIYTQEVNLLEKFCREAIPERTGDSHALASVRIRREMGELVCADISDIRNRAKTLFYESSKEMDRRYL